MDQERKKEGGGNRKRVERDSHRVLYWLRLGADLFGTAHFMTLRAGDPKFNHLGRTLHKKRSQE